MNVYMIWTIINLVLLAGVVALIVCAARYLSQHYNYKKRNV
ncbi:MAG: hypothetical protein VB112_07970 [Oscillospiraceae bacterium]|nr:hypothetical protein [Oscillospiraceae bacterium]